MLKPAALATLPAAYAAQPAVTQPTPAGVRAARLAAALDVDQAAKLVHVTTQTWVSYERPPRSPSARGMPTGLWELFQIKTNATPAAGYALLRPIGRPSSDGVDEMVLRVPVPKGDATAHTSEHYELSYVNYPDWKVKP